MSPRLTYWTGYWGPGREGISGELAAVRAALAPGAPVVSYSRAQTTSWRTKDGVWRLSGRRWLTLRLLAGLLERRGDLTHVWGGLGSWHLLRSVGRRPVILTVASAEGSMADLAVRRPNVLVAESESSAERLRADSTNGPVIEVIAPGVDLDRFRATDPPPASPFRLLFASTPVDPEDVEPRGVPLLVEVARRRPDVEVVVRWRPWGSPRDAQARLAELDPPRNVRVEFGFVTDMATEYQRCHAVAALFAPGCGKSCPTSIVEGLASGRPALITGSLGFAGRIADAAAGRVVSRDVEAVCDAIDELRRELLDASVRARDLAERAFDLRDMVAAYRDLYARQVAATRELRR